MSQPRDDIILWGQNAPLRRFLIVSNLMLCWIGCDLTLQTLSNVNMVGHDFWVVAHHVTGISWRRMLLDDWPIDMWRLHLYTAYSLPAIGLLMLVLLDRLVSQGETRLDPREVSANAMPRSLKLVTEDNAATSQKIGGCHGAFAIGLERDDFEVAFTARDHELMIGDAGDRARRGRFV